MKRFALLVLAFLFVPAVFAQQPVTGLPPFGSLESSGLHTLNRQNLNMNFASPIVSSPGRGVDLRLALVHDSLFWTKGATAWSPVLDGAGQPTWGWTRANPVGTAKYRYRTFRCVDDYGQNWTYRTYDNYIFTDQAGTAHPFNFSIDVTADEEWHPGCVDPGPPTTAYAADGSGYLLDATLAYNPKVYSGSGFGVAWGGPAQDTNGNYISSANVGGGETDWTDTLGRVTLKVIVGTGSVQYKTLDQSGGYQTFTLTLTSYNIKTKFSCSGVSEYTQNSVYLPTQLDLPNGTHYSFTYEDTPTFSGYKTARLRRVTLPTGGYYEYQYPETPNNGVSCVDGNPNSLTIVVSDGTTPSTFQYARTQVGSDWKTKVTPPALPYDGSVSNESTFTFNSTGQQTVAKIYQGTEAGANVLRTINSTWTNGTPTSQTVILEDTPGSSKLQSKTVTTFDSYGNLKEIQESDYGAGAPPSSYVRKTTYAYLHEGNSAYVTKNILDRITSIQMYDSSGSNKKAETLIEYDQGTIASATGAPHHDDTGFGTGFSTRGNPTKIRRWLTGATYLETTRTYDMLGNVKTIQDPGGHSTSIDYADSWYGTSCTFPSPTYAYQTKVTNAANQDTRLKYYPCTGQVQAVQDPNDYANSRNGTEIAYADSMLRLTQVKAPDGGQTDISYSDSARTVTTTVKRTSSASISTTDTFNTLGQLAQRQLPGGRLIDITYDSLGGQWIVTNPYVSTSDSTYGYVETKVDGLGRVISVIKQDGSSATQFSYKGNATSVTDEVSRQRVVQYDGLGRMINVCEVTSGNSRSSAANCNISQFSSASGYLTAYTFNERGDLTQSTTGGQIRYFTYDNLSRLTGARIREVSTSTDVSYVYDSDSNRTLISDTRGLVCFVYDSLHRVTSKKHAASTCSSATVKAEFTYDGSASNNAIGHLITEKDGTGSVDKMDYTYDPVGRVLSMTRTVSSTAYAMTYEYDLLGNLLKLSYPSSSGTRRKVEYSFNSSGESTAVKDITDTNNQYNYISNVQYANLGPLSQMDFGSETNPVRTTIGWTKKALIDSILTQKTGSGGATFLNLGYVYNADGKIQKVKFNNDVNDTKTETYTYDDLGRLLTAQRGPDSNIQRKYSYDYDLFGNRWGQNVTGGSGLTSSLAFDNTNYNNRITDTGFSYAEGSATAGNLTANGSGTSYTYSQENFMLTAGSSITYTVDAQGRRVKKTISGTTTDYFYVGADLLAEKTGSTWKDYIFFAGQRMAEQTGSTAASAVYLHTDHLGSTRRCTDANGDSAGTCDYEPFGENQPGTSCSVPTKFRFAGMQFDDDTNLYHTWFREYDPNQGRWMSVDPLPGQEDDPQTRDRYVYVRNDPINLVDPLGLLICLVTFHHRTIRVPGDEYVDNWTTFDGCFNDDPPGGGGDWDLGDWEDGGGAGEQQQPQAKKDPCPADKRRFFNWLDTSLGNMAKYLDTKKALLFTLAAKEGGWTNADLNHNMPLNNPFGVNEIKNGKAVGNINYPSLNNAIQSWEKMFGERVQGVNAADDFVYGLLHPDKGQPYNTINPKYDEQYQDLYDTVLKYMKLCGII